MNMILSILWVWDNFLYYMEIEFKSMLGAFFVIFVRVKDIEVKNKIFLDRIMKIVKKVRYIFIFYFLFINDVVYLVNYKF